MLDELKKLFIQEVTELLQKTEKDLLALEKDKDNPEIVADIFRTMHTIKGSAGVYNLDKTVLLAHSFENLFSKIKEHKIAASNDIISLALSAKDIILSLIEADSEDIIPASEINKFTDEVARLLADVKIGEQKTLNSKRTKSFHILFEPNNDIETRGVNVETLLQDFDEFDSKYVKKYKDEQRNESGKLKFYYEIIVATEYSINDLKAIFLFVPNEFSISEICKGNIFENEEFVDFYENAVVILPDSNLRLELLLNFAKTFEENLIEKKETTDKEIIENVAEEEFGEILIGEEEISETVTKEDQQIEHIRVSATKLDDLLNLVSELIINNSQLGENVENRNYSNILDITENISKITNSIKENTLSLRLVPIKNILSPYRRMIRYLSLKFGKKIRFYEEGVDTLVDKNIVERLFTPLSHIIRNAIDHGIERPEKRVEKGKDENGVIRFIAYYSNANVIIQIQDDGRGIDPQFIKHHAVRQGYINSGAKMTKKEIYDLVFIHGFTTAEKITDISGRGVGMDAIKTAIQELRGDIEIDSEIELGTSVTIKLPLTLSIIETLHVSTNNMNFLIPVTNIDQCVKIKHSELVKKSGNRVMIDDDIIPFIDIRELFKIEGEREDEENMIILKHGKHKIGLIFSTIKGEYQAVIKQLGTFFRELDYLIGATILGDNSIGYILDSYKLMKRIKIETKLD